MARLLADQERIAAAGPVASPAQPFQVPAQSDIGRGQGASVYGSGVAPGVDGFRFGFFGGPGTIAPNQGGAELETVWFNLANGRSQTELLSERGDVLVDTTVRSRALDTGTGMVVAAEYGSLWHRWPVPVSAADPDGFRTNSARSRSRRWAPSSTERRPGVHAGTPRPWSIGFSR
ncbi:hypothetical protein OG225_26930 [Nocardia sp. NBC_01377]|uniref:hypothetical protein n=1 Tax=Nocardia sp. NBC_01377 TaxID=2903595 RepID=UPI00324AFB81